MDTDELL